uniref:Uncharacterized protein n=1 Tax=Plectus sambesii TaxID=2011161 RepID=A0A914WZQ8_9BILA
MSAPLQPVRLNDLLLVGVATHLQFIDRIFQERVSRRFTQALRAANDVRPISLTIDKNKWIEGSPFTFVRINTFEEEGDKKTFRKQLSASEERITDAFAMLFSRYKKLCHLTILAEPTNIVTESVLSLIAQAKLQPSKLRHLNFSLDKAVNVDFRLIKAFSPLIRSLALNCSLPTTEADSQKLWTSVAECINLHKLSFFPQNSIMRCSRDAPKSDTFSNAHLCECLKLRKVRYFRSGYGARSFHADWLTEAFQDNEKIRKLFIKDYNLRLNTFTAPSVLPIISRLSTIGLNFELIETPNEQESDILKILCALKKKGFPTVTQKMDYSTLSEVDLVEPVKDTKALEEALTFWLKTSDQTICLINCALFYLIIRFQ